MKSCRIGVRPAVPCCLHVARPSRPLPTQCRPNQYRQCLTVRNKPTAWDQEAAAKYLDDRMDLWFEKARKLRTGQGNTSCASCHNTVPYALARPALRKAAGMSQPTPQEAKLLDETLRRVDTYGSHEQIIKSKDEQSRGTEAVLNLLVLAGEDARQNRQVPSEPTRKALESYGKSNVRTEPGIGWTSGMSLTSPPTAFTTARPLRRWRWEPPLTTQAARAITCPAASANCAPT